MLDAGAEARTMAFARRVTATLAVALPQWWFFCVFLAGAGYLWWERR